MVLMDTRARTQLRTIAVATPCRERWDRMAGIDSVRHCASCKSNVFNLSAMDDAQVDALLASAEDACIRFYARPDGTLVKTNCSTGPRRAPHAVAAGVAMSLATTTAFVGIDAVTEPNEVASVNGEPVLVAMGMKLTIKPHAPKRAGFATSSIRHDAYHVASDASMQLGPVAVHDPAPSKKTWRKAAAGAVLALFGLFALVARRKHDAGEPR